jgi:hypothetical protein
MFHANYERERLSRAIMIAGTIKLTEKMLRDAEEMRAFYRSMGISLTTIERAVEAKFEPPSSEKRGTWHRRKRRGSPSAA